MASHTDLQDKPWWHGYVPRKEAARLIEQEGDFLIRASSPGPAPEIILTACNDRLERIHATLRFDGNWFLTPMDSATERITFATISDLVQFYITHPQKTVQLVRGIPRLEPELKRGTIRFEKNNSIWEGAYATTFWCNLLRPHLGGDPLPVAVKVPLNEGENADETAARKERLLVEARKLLYCLHPNVARFHGIVAEGAPLLIVSEFAPGRDLRAHVRKYGPTMDNREKLLYLMEVAAGVNYLHQKKIVHRALAARNCLISAAGKIKVADYGINSHIDAGSGDPRSCWCSAEGPPLRWLAPETLGSSYNFSKASDCWSYGILAYEMFANAEVPWPDMSNIEATPHRMVELMKRVWNEVPQRRLSMAQIGKEITEMISDTIRLIGAFHPDLLTLNSIPGVKRAKYYEPKPSEFMPEAVMTAVSKWTNSSTRSSSATSLPPPPVGAPPTAGSIYVDSRFKENDSSVYVAPSSTPSAGERGESSQSQSSSSGSGIRLPTYSSDPYSISRKYYGGGKNYYVKR
ncbi:hypothetical protein PRIPAC_70033 [Pristionchus pacificus]|uniref:Tyrosine-protein kinase n=1 Tax=Pristionchus pacificus TaxID=54126 RepID=A0A2A6C0J9_PRIPA|nr:hypothetical protein PRIPAC_70033 [Pristionchus pacificus]|eukprot:PDM71670.1 protein kinase [Pristionchus pacificus]